MKRSLKKIRKKLIRIGEMVLEVYNRQNRPIGQFRNGKMFVDGKELDNLELRNGTFYKDDERIELFAFSMQGGRPHLDKETNSVWKTIRKTNEYVDVVRAILSSNDLCTNIESVEDVLQEYLYDILFDIWSGKLSSDSKELDDYLSERTKLLIEDFKNEKHEFNVIVPLFNIELDSWTVKLGSHGILRRARYSQKMEYTPKYPKSIYPYGPDRLDYILELERSSPTRPPTPELAGKYMNTAGSIIMAMRLLFGGGAGLLYLVMWSQPVFEEPRIGAIHVTGNATLPAPRALTPGNDDNPTFVQVSQLPTLRNLIDILERCDTELFLLRALRRFGTASIADSSTDSMVDSIIGLECLFGGSKILAAPRIAKIMTDDADKRNEIEDSLGKCWAARAKLVHGRSKSQAEKAAGDNLVDKAMWLVQVLRICLLRALLLNPRSAENLQQMIDDF